VVYIYTYTRMYHSICIVIHTYITWWYTYVHTQWYIHASLVMYIPTYKWMHLSESSIHISRNSYKCTYHPKTFWDIHTCVYTCVYYTRHEFVMQSYMDESCHMYNDSARRVFISLKISLVLICSHVLMSSWRQAYVYVCRGHLNMYIRVYQFEDISVTGM